MTKMSNPLKVIDISEDSITTARELLDAATSQGFLFLEGHDFTQKEVDKLFELSKSFFELPNNYKSKYPVDSSNHGYVMMGKENLDPNGQKQGDPKEALNIANLNFETGKSLNIIPDWISENQERDELISNTILRLYRLSIKILRMLARALEIEDDETHRIKGENWFASKYASDSESGSTFRLLHYPCQKSLNPESVIRAGAHTDYGSMTLLFQKENQEGLEIFSPISKKWEQVPFIPSTIEKMAPPLVVNIGDLLSYWTAGLLKSTIHRVKFPAKAQELGQDRYSIVFFSHPSDNALLEPVPSEIIRKIEGRGANKETTYITAKQHLQKRLAATYGWKK